MSQQIINIGTIPNDGTGDPIRTGAVKINSNFTELYTNAAISANLTVGVGANGASKFYTDETGIYHANNTQLFSANNTQINFPNFSSNTTLATVPGTLYAGVGQFGGTFAANSTVVALAAGSQLYANGAAGAVDSVLSISNTGFTYWKNVSSAGLVNTNFAYVWTNSHTFQAGILANNSTGGAGSTLTTNGSGGLYWANPTASGSVNTGFAYTWSNTQTFSNVVFNGPINAGGIDGTNPSFLTSNGSSAPYWTAVGPQGVVNTNFGFTWLAPHTFSAPLTVGAALDAGGNGAVGSYLTSNGSATPYWTPVGPQGVVNAAYAFTWTAGHTFNNSISLNNVINLSGTSGAAGSFLTSNGASAPYWTAVGPQGVVNTSYAFTWSNGHVFNSGLSVNGPLQVNTGPISINGDPGSSGYVLTSNGVNAPFWAAPSSSGDVNTSFAYTFSNNITFSQNVVINTSASITGKTNSVPSGYQFIDAFPQAAASVFYDLYVVGASGRRMCKVNLLTDGTTQTVVEYGTVVIGTDPVTLIDSTTGGGQVILAMQTSEAVTFKFIKHHLG